MKLEVSLSDLKRTSKSLNGAADEMGDLRADLNRSMNSLSYKTLSQGGVQSTFTYLMRELDGLQSKLELLSELTRRKREEYEQADREGKKFNWGKLASFLTFALGTVLDFLPVVGNVKGIIEAITGRDLLTGEKLAWYERGLSVLGPLGKGANKAASLFKYADEAMDLTGKAVKHADDAADAAKTVGRNADDAIDAIPTSPNKAGVPGNSTREAGEDMAGATPKSTKAGEAPAGSRDTGDAPMTSNKPTGKADDAPSDAGSTRHDTGLTDAEKAAAAAGTAAGTGSAAAASMIKKTPGGSAAKGAEPPGAPKSKDIETSSQSPSTGRNTETQNVTKSNKESCPGDPIHAATGYQFMNHDILTLHGATDWPLTLIYHSGLLQRGELGPAWTHQYGLRLHVHSSIQDSAERAPAVDVYWTAGRHNSFIHQADGTYRSSDLDVYWDVLEREEDGWKLTTREPREIYRFTEEGQLLSHTQSSGLTLDMSYQAAGRLMTLTDRATQRSLHLDYTSTGELKEVKDALRRVTFEYSSEGVLVHVIEPGGVVTDLVSDEDGRLISLTESGILQFTNTFDASYRIVEQTDAAGSKFQFQYDTESHSGQTWTTVTNRLGQARILVHDDALQLLEVHAEDGGITRYTYTPQGQMASVTNPLGETTTYVYDEEGHLIREIDPLGHETEYHYTSHHQVARETDAEGGVTTYQYDEQQRLTEVTRPDGSIAKWTYTETGQTATYQDFTGAIWTYAYSETGELQHTLDPEGRRLQVGWDKAGRLIELKDAAGSVSRRSYDGADRLTSITDPLGLMWQTVYDASGQWIRETRPSGASMQYTYTPNGEVATITDALGHTRQYTYDAENRLIAETNALGETTQLSYDAAGRLQAVTDASGHITKYHYDGAGRLVSVIDGEGRTVQQLTYDAAGRPVAWQDGLGHMTRLRFNALHQRVEDTDADGHTRHYRYDAAHRLTEVIQGEGADEVTYRQTWDGEDRHTSYTDASGNETRLTYDRSGRLLQETNAAGARTAYTYDNRGWLSTKLDAKGQETRYAYDAAGRLIRATDEAGEIVLTYTPDGQVARVLEAEQHEERTYDAAGRVLTRTDGFGHLLQYAYDAAGRMTALTYPDGKVVQYRYQATGELAEVKDWNGRLTRYRYDASGKLIETRRPNGSQEQREYDGAGQLTRLTDTSGQGIRLQQFKYAYSPSGLLLKEENKQYTYDTLKRLRSGAELGRVVHYTYDPSGNLTTEQMGTSETESTSISPTQHLHYTWDNRLQRVGDYPVEMDANGNLLYATDGNTASAYEYDARNRMVKAGKLKYRYNPQGDRIEIAQRGQVTRYVIDDAHELSRVLMEMDGEGNVKSRYIYGLGLIGREDADGTYLSYHYDLRGSTTLLTDEQNRVTDRYTYGLYGELEQHEGLTQQPFAYNGRDGVMTDANGLYYMRARYYDPKLKRFLNRDVIRGEIQDGQTFNRYAYVNGNPVSYIDPLGLMKCENEHYVRYGSEKEARDSLDAKGLVPKVHDNGTVSRGSKWISEKGSTRDPRDLGDRENYTHTIMIETRKGAKDWLQSKGIDFEDMVGGESKYTNRVVIKSKNEAGSYGVGSGLLDEFNKDWVVKITTEKIPTSKKNKGR
ncbi:RHS repeat-associated core domain-containing protein [Paenibacillus sp. PAMC 26794]|uniref:RHS repeat-associated core domain-containing protein n=1 Tax=Paenibacillus sp. PAMC 26794 TaxID=1257080 RepID=UPI000312E058|nr:RHS repeat-associated core domain-containing protein [Paenibacillus sp. PAMC 26794]